jgi:hypothetical protein
MSPHPRSRQGRLLLEGLVSILLLSAAALAMLAGTRATSLLADDATLVARAHALSTAAAERAHGAPCTPDGREATATLPRVQVREVITARERLQVVQVGALLHFSPLARSTIPTLALSSARLCP